MCLETLWQISVESIEKYHSCFICLSSRGTIQLDSLSSSGRMKFDVSWNVDWIIFFKRFHALGDGLTWFGHLKLDVFFVSFYPVIYSVLNSFPFGSIMSLKWHTCKYILHGFIFISDVWEIFNCSISSIIHL